MDVTISIPDEVTKRLGGGEREVLIELACRLFDADLLEKPDATRLCGLERAAFEAELRKRGLAVWRVDYDLEEDLRALRAMGHAV
jgi:predicted HTH domain antitoxin